MQAVELLLVVVCSLLLAIGWVWIGEVGRGREQTEKRRALPRHRHHIAPDTPGLTTAAA
jgi:hypothetical protein